MAAMRDFVAGGYRYIPAVFQYSSGVAALPSYEIQRVSLSRPVPLKDGFRLIEQFITDAGRPLTAFCACELRSPVPFTPDGFRDFNKIYVETLKAWGIYGGGDDDNPVARSNVCPQIDPPAEPSLHAFSFTAKSDNAQPTCVISGSAEARGVNLPYEQKMIRFGETSTDAMREKARFVVEEMSGRLAALGFKWADVSATQLYTIYDFHSFFADELVRRGAGRNGLTWHFNRPPVNVLTFEMDCRSVALERFKAV
jgi:hypothetical protein